ncbi:OmpA family protein [Kangiella marina]|uniref:OmpA-like domain-containing protein n=1 Tax=Kangiella marina TaxID=1079178 RepID=A0ABP8IJQ0_9GAMM
MKLLLLALALLLLLPGCELLNKTFSMGAMSEEERYLEKKRQSERDKVYIYQKEVVSAEEYMHIIDKSFYRNFINEEQIQVIRYADSKYYDVALRLKGRDIFRTDSEVLTNNAKDLLDRIASLLNVYDKSTITVVGFTDNVGAAKYNMSLSKNRADSVLSNLVLRGVELDRLKSCGLGEKYPIATNRTEIGRATNRRVEIHISTYFDGRECQ